MNLEQEKTTLSTDCMSACIQHAQSGMKKCYTTVFLLRDHPFKTSAFFRGEGLIQKGFLACKQGF